MKELFNQFRFEVMEAQIYKSLMFVQTKKHVDNIREGWMRRLKSEFSPYTEKMQNKIHMLDIELTLKQILL